MKKLKKQLVLVTLMALMLQIGAVGGVGAFALAPGAVVINEIAWAGSADASGDEWIELYNNGNTPVDLSGWYIEDDGSSKYTIAEGAIAAHGYFVIEDSEDVLTGSADVVIGLSLANAGDSLALKDSVGNVIDAVNSSGGAWYAGDSGSKASMERIDPSVTEDKPENWASAVSDNGVKGMSGSAILGTPGSANSVYGGDGPEISFAGENIVYTGETLNFAVNVSDVSDLYAYGFEINYNPAVLRFAEAGESDFLATGGVSTAFNAALANGEGGKLIIGNARLLNPADGVDGNGKLFDVTFEVIGGAGEKTNLSFGAGSFLSNSEGDMQGRYGIFDVSVGEGNGKVAAVSGARAAESEERYGIDLSWEAGEADYYLLHKKMPDGEYAKIGETSEPQFRDSDSIVPNVDYEYKIIAVKGGILSAAVDVRGVENRGLSGDNDRSDSVDGRDVERLARAFGSEYGDEEYILQVDGNFDGIIDGSDLIDIGVNFALIY